MVHFMHVEPTHAVWSATRMGSWVCAAGQRVIMRGLGSIYKVHFVARPTQICSSLHQEYVSVYV